jgi:hypothetical protein
MAVGDGAWGRGQQQGRRWCNRGLGAGADGGAALVARTESAAGSATTDGGVESRTRSSWG